MSRPDAEALATADDGAYRPELVSVWDLRIDDEAWLDHQWERVVAFEWHLGCVALTTERDGWRRRRRLAADDAVQRRAAWV